jgi:hypothetical protein
VSGGPAGGRVPLESTVLRMAGTGPQVSVGERLGEGGQGVVHAATFGGTIAGAVEAHPTAAGQVVLRNVGKQAWTMKPDGEPPKRVTPARRLAVRGMTIDFGAVRGRIIGG